MVIQSSSCKEKEWRDKALCGFQKFKPSVIKGQLPLPKMDHILQRVVGSQRMSMLDGFLGYNQVAIHLVTKRRQLSPLHGEPLCMLRCPLV